MKARYAEAGASLLRRALAIGEASLGPDRPDDRDPPQQPARTCCSDTNRPGEAEPLFRRALAIREASLGPDHPKVATDLNNLAGLLRATNRPAEAEPLYRRALAIDEESLGPDHPDVATVLNNLAEPAPRHEPPRRGRAALFAARWRSARRASGRTIPRWRSASTISRFCSTITNRLGEAEPLYRRALAIDEASYGPDHPEVATDLNNLAVLLQATNRLGEAEPLYRRALAIRKKSLGMDHPRTVTVRENLAALEAGRDGAA